MKNLILSTLFHGEDNEDDNFNIIGGKILKKRSRLQEEETQSVLQRSFSNVSDTSLLATPEPLKCYYNAERKLSYQKTEVETPIKEYPNQTLITEMKQLDLENLIGLEEGK
jgi:hypothetical protein